ncbi:nucleotide sugar dehydrogenase [Desulfobacter postgatei]|uniref:UDP-glucose 6-dehydrogenase n=1 Tax=Desulfobacter postgatei 2ac9 TaxID=879212 RepID=I5B6K9_9BACT|nr:UDP-glucose/GDP-mannose dehydrogenase family protein [Desulfobacter postgatei]EIM65122.1 nucleotide sugar dehydrogenase [Desulfobacter postgatei 2ac9]
MKISIFGMGYVGAVSAGCLAGEGHEIIGVDSVQAKVDLINKGLTPIIEKDIGELIQAAVKEGRLQATTDAAEAVAATDISFVCVGTPSQLNGNLDLKYIRRVCEKIGSALQEKNGHHVVVIRSTILPGTMRSVVIPTLETASGKKAGKGFGVCNNPEFLREGTAVYDFHNPPKTVIGEIDAASGDILAELYQKMDAPIIRTDLETAEMVKYVDNCWHALKVGFANEVGNICKAVGTDGHRVMDIFCKDTKLNLSPYYLKPGFAFGGSCLPKDLRALTYKGKSLDLELPILNSIIPSNLLQIERGLNMILTRPGRKVGVLGFSFKAGTDDLRESPMVEVIERLLGKGYDIRIYDKNVNLARLVGANRDYILNLIPHIAKMMVQSVDDILAHADTIVIGNNDPEFEAAMERISGNQIVIDLVRVAQKQSHEGVYDGICW